VQRESAHAEPSVSPAAPPPEAVPAAGEAADIEELVEEVYARLRWRLASERERNLSWG
jgi:hypothetical protein